MSAATSPNMTPLHTAKALTLEEGRSLVTSTYHAIPSGAMKCFLDINVTISSSPAELRELVMNTFSFEEVQASGVMPFIDAFESLDQLLAPEVTPTRAKLATPQLPTSPIAPHYIPLRTFKGESCAHSFHFPQMGAMIGIDGAVPSPMETPRRKGNSSKKGASTPTRALKPAEGLGGTTAISTPITLEKAFRKRSVASLEFHASQQGSEVTLLQLPTHGVSHGTNPHKLSRAQKSIPALSKNKKAKEKLKGAISKQDTVTRRFTVQRTKTKKTEASPAKEVAKKVNSEVSLENLLHAKRSRLVCDAGDEEEWHGYDEDSDASAGPSRAGGKGSRSGDPQWTATDDAKLLKLHKKHGSKWQSIAASFPRFTAPQCAQRWRRVARPGLVRGPWSPNEEELLLDAMSRPGDEIVSSFAQCSSIVGTRSDICCRYWWSSKLAWRDIEDAALMRAADSQGGAVAVLKKENWLGLYVKARNMNRHPNGKFRTPRDYLLRLKELLAKLQSPLCSPAVSIAVKCEEHALSLSR